ncbi:hypothetical protein Pelo_18438 [Pelomyxa schiedti]|nr:hypothetical protein Pelo_18438 [Pelomyxa schiedti]
MTRKKSKGRKLGFEGATGIKVTKPDWLGDIIIHEGGLSAHAQFSSLALAAVSARCGARSPTRALGAHMLRQLWDDWVVGCQRVAVLDAEVMPCGRGKGKHCVITFVRVVV